MYTADHILRVIQTNYLIYEDGEETTLFKLAMGMEPSVSNLLVLFCPYVVWKATVQVGTKVLNIRHQAQKGFRHIFVGIT